jgi:hypothetical protein
MGCPGELAPRKSIALPKTFSNQHMSFARPLLLTSQLERFNELSMTVVVRSFKLVHVLSMAVCARPKRPHSQHMSALPLL